ncbi:hypothetical protein D3C80_1862570 [compost metagenome]
MVCKLHAHDFVMGNVEPPLTDKLNHFCYMEFGGITSPIKTRVVDFMTHKPSEAFSLDRLNKDWFSGGHHVST